MCQYHNDFPFQFITARPGEYCAVFLALSFQRSANAPALASSKFRHTTWEEELSMLFGYAEARNLVFFRFACNVAWCCHDEIKKSK
jgi:hypothetical protein